MGHQFFSQAVVIIIRITGGLVIRLRHGQEIAHQIVGIQRRLAHRGAVETNHLHAGEPALVVVGVRPVGNDGVVIGAVRRIAVSDFGQVDIREIAGGVVEFECKLLRVATRSRDRAHHLRGRNETFATAARHSEAPLLAALPVNLLRWST